MPVEICRYFQGWTQGLLQKSLTNEKVVALKGGKMAKEISNSLHISSIFDNCSILQQTQSRPNHTSYRNFLINEFVANALRDNIGSKNQPLTSEKKWGCFLILDIKNLGSG